MSIDPALRSDSDPGVPEALPRTLRLLGQRVGAQAIDRVWVFPPLIRGRREWGLVAAGCYGENPGTLRLITARYQAELSGSGLRYEPELAEEGEAPGERLPRVMEGVVRRASTNLGDPRLVEIGGDPERLDSLMEELEPEAGAMAEAVLLNRRDRTP